MSHQTTDKVEQIIIFLNEMQDQYQFFRPASAKCAANIDAFWGSFLEKNYKKIIN